MFLCGHIFNFVTCLLYSNQKFGGEIMEFAVGYAVGYVALAIIIYFAIRRARKKPVRPVNPTQISHFEAKPSHLCPPPTSCGFTVVYQITGDSVTNIKLKLVKDGNESLLAENQQNFSRSFLNNTLQGGAGRYVVSLKADSQEQTREIFLLDASALINHIAVAYVDKDGQYSISNTFTLGNSRTLANYTFCDKVAFLKSIKYISSGTEDDSIAIEIPGLLPFTLRLQQENEFPNDGILIDNPPIVVFSRHTRSSGPAYTRGDTRSWTLQLKIFCLQS
jgi:hypothetical protein